MGICCVYGCSNRTDKKKKSGVSFHKFPKNEELKEKWVKAVRWENWTLRPYSIICSEHFLEKFVNRTSACGRIELRENAIPTVFPSYPSYLQTQDKGDQRTTELTFDGDYSESGTNSPTSNLQQPPTKKLKEADPVERQNELLKLACDLLSTSSKPEESNEFLDIGKVWGTKLMSLDPMQRRFAEKAINEILFEADLGTLHRDSVKINCNPKSDPFENI